MIEDFDKKIVEACPHLYRDRNGDMRNTAMNWGFETGSGWEQLIWDLSLKLEALIVQLKDENPTVDPKYLPAASQVKEKFGGLRFYMTTSTDEMDDLIGEAARKSYSTCEDCGKYGIETPGGWISVRCAEHWPKDCEFSFDDMVEKKRDERPKQEE